MKATEAQSVGDIIRTIIEGEGRSADFNRQKIVYLWSEIVGPKINQATIRRYIEGDVLHVYISSASLKSELAFMVAPLIKALNEAVGARVITKIAIH